MCLEHAKHVNCFVTIFFSHPALNCVTFFFVKRIYRSALTQSEIKFYRVEMPPHIWKEIALVETPLIRQLHWPIWGNISSGRGDFRYTTLQSLWQSKRFLFSIISVCHFYWIQNTLILNLSLTTFFFTFFFTVINFLDIYLLVKSSLFQTFSFFQVS